MLFAYAASFFSFLVYSRRHTFALKSVAGNISFCMPFASVGVGTPWIGSANGEFFHRADQFIGVQ